MNTNDEIYLVEHNFCSGNVICNVVKGRHAVARLFETTVKPNYEKSKRGACSRRSSIATIQYDLEADRKRMGQFLEQATPPNAQYQNFLTMDVRRADTYGCEVK